MSKQVEEPRKLSRAAVETLAIIAYHQPVTRAEIEEIRGVATAKGTLDVLLEAGFVRMRGPAQDFPPADHVRHDGRLPVAFRPVRRGRSAGLDELKQAGMFEGRAAGLSVPLPSDDPALRADEDPLDQDDPPRRRRRADQCAGRAAGRTGLTLARKRASQARTGSTRWRTSASPESQTVAWIHPRDRRDRPPAGRATAVIPASLDIVGVSRPFGPRRCSITVAVDPRGGGRPACSVRPAAGRRRSFV